MRSKPAVRLRRRAPVPRPTIGSAFAAFFLPAIARSGIIPVAAFGSNPGALRMQVFSPPRLPKGRPLIVVLHGCRQGAAAFAAESGWLAVAQQFRSALLLPEQTNENNAGRCFNWFRPDDVRRGSGEAMSIRQMIRDAVKRFGSDPRQIFVVDFSAGGGMAAAMLAAYPAVFAAGGIVAGMPVGCVSTPVGAMLHMRRANTGRTRQTLANDVRAVTGSRSRKSWPRLSIWQGERDRTVDPGNAEVLAQQWSELHGFSAAPLTDQMASGARQRVWGQPNRLPSVELWTLAKMGHGFPIDPRTPLSGHVGPWVVDAGLCAARLMTAFWGLSGAKPPNLK